MIWKNNLYSYQTTFYYVLNHDLLEIFSEKKIHLVVAPFTEFIGD